MSDVNDIKTQSGSQDDVTQDATGTISSGSINGIPGSSFEAPISEELPSIEQKKSIEIAPSVTPPEQLQSPEVLPTPEIQKLQEPDHNIQTDKQDNVTTSIANTDPEEKVENIVDMRTEVRDKNVSDNATKLTENADDEEDEYRQNVISIGDKGPAHGSD